MEPAKSEALNSLVFTDKTCYKSSLALRVLECTLFSRAVHEQKANVSLSLDDLYHFDDRSVDAHQVANRANLDWLDHEIDTISRLEPDRKVVVLTHYCPLTNQ
jgi:hypothetical protein